VLQAEIHLEAEREIEIRSGLREKADLGAEATPEIGDYRKMSVMSEP
jgi:hypothetical protein